VTEVYTYKTEDEWVGYTYKDGICFMSAHTTKEKYSILMLKKILETFNMLGEVVSILPHDYLVDFYKRHADVTLINEEDRLYKLTKKDVEWV